MSTIHELRSSDPIESFENSHTFNFSLDGNSVRYGNRTADGFTIVLDNTDDSIEYNGNAYRRLMRVAVVDGKLACINVLPIEEYLYGVVPGEMPVTWNIEALKAQAVASRTYAIRQMQENLAEQYDVVSSVYDQVYIGRDGEKDASNQACLDTWGQICTYNDVPVYAYFHSASGGWTSDSYTTFGKFYPYLKSVESYDSDAVVWDFSITAGALRNLLGANGLSVGFIESIGIEGVDMWGRITDVSIHHASGVEILRASEFRRMIGYVNLKSTRFLVNGIEIPGFNELRENSLPEFNGYDFDKFRYLHPGLIIPIPVESSMDSILVADSEGSLSSLCVMDGSGEVNIPGEEIFIAVPVTREELDEFEHVSYASQNTTSMISNDQNSEIICNAVDGKFTFSGTGFGHGVGMSQYGARALADSGWGYNQILMHFYSGIRIEQAW
jgi:stage II sporulation protein D